MAIKIYLYWRKQRIMVFQSQVMIVDRRCFLIDYLAKDCQELSELLDHLGCRR